MGQTHSFEDQLGRPVTVMLRLRTDLSLEQVLALHPSGFSDHTVLFGEQEIDKKLSC